MNDPLAKLNSILIPPNMPILEALEVLNSAHKRIVLVVDDERHLLGIVTDSNFRRAILEKISFEEPVSKIMRERPVVASANFTDIQLLKLMETTTHYQIPVLDDGGRLVDVCFLDDLIKSQAESSVAIIMAGGLGTRLHPLTENKPKPLLEVGGRPLLFSILDHLVDSGVQKIIVALNFHGDSIREAIGKEDSLSEYVQFVEENKRLGTAGPISLIPEPPSGPFIIMNGDLLTKVAIDEMLRFHRYERNVLTVALREESYEVPFGVARVEGTRILSVDEKPKHTHLINAGIYIAEPYVIDRIPKDTFFDMTNLIDDLIANDLRVGSFPVHEYWLDIGAPEQLDQAQHDYSSVFRNDHE